MVLLRRNFPKTLWDLIVHCQDINFWGNVYPTYVALPYLRQSNGRVVVNAAVESWLPLPRMSLYAVSIYKSRELLFSMHLRRKKTKKLVFFDMHTITLIKICIVEWLQLRF
jgi:hypothetical protein